MNISSTSTELVFVLVTSTEDPTSSLTVSVGFSSTSDPPDTYYTATWTADSVTQLNNFTQTRASVLVGPAGGAVTLTEGNYVVWVKAITPVETVTDVAGYLRVTP